MYGRALCVAAVVAAHATYSSALLIPPGVNNLKGTPDMGGSSLFKERTVELPCPSCGLPPCPLDSELVRPVDDLFWMQDAQQSLSLHFRLSDDYRRLELNGLPIFALGDIDDGENDQAEPLLQPAVRSFVLEHSSTPADADPNDQPLTTSIAFRSEARHIRKTNKHGGAYIVIDVEMLGWRAQFSKQGRVVVELLRPAADGLLLYGATAVDSHDVHPFDTKSKLGTPRQPTAVGPVKSEEEQSSCILLPALLCKIKAFVDEKLSSVQSVQRYHGHHREHSHHFFDRFLSAPPPCPRKVDDQALESPSTDDASSDLDILNDAQAAPPSFSRGRPHHVRLYANDDRHHHHDDHDHSVVGYFAPWLIAVMIPVVVGITIGLTACLIGLVAGRLVQILWIGIVRGGHRGQVSRGSNNARSFSKSTAYEQFCEDVDPVPAYEHAPAYEAVEGEQQQVE